MGKVLVLLLIMLLALASVAGYLVLTEKITAGERQLADGQRQLEKGQVSLEEGKAKLEAGKRELSEGKQGVRASSRQPVLGISGQAAERRTGLQGGERADHRRREAGCQRRGQGERRGTAS